MKCKQRQRLGGISSLSSKTVGDKDQEETQSVNDSNAAVQTGIRAYFSAATPTLDSDADDVFQEGIPSFSQLL